MSQKTHTVGGTIERGPASQRHFARAIDADVDDASTVVSHSDGTVVVAAEDGSIRPVLDLAQEWGGDVEFGLGNLDKAHQYDDGMVSLNVTIE